LGSRGQLGTGNSETKLVPTAVTFIRSHVYQVAASGDQTLALLGNQGFCVGFYIKGLPRSRLGQDLDALRSNGSYSDVTLISSDGKPFKAHKISIFLVCFFLYKVISARCPSLASMFSDVKNEEVSLKIPANNLSVLLEYLYTDRVPVVPDEEAKELTAIAAVITVFCYFLIF
jgi:hypothetical protein